MEQRLTAVPRAVETVQPALAKFYSSLSDEQKERFDRLRPAQGGSVFTLFVGASRRPYAESGNDRAGYQGSTL
jgi:LTXXQ motif family protein